MTPIPGACRGVYAAIKKKGLGSQAPFSSWQHAVPRRARTFKPRLLEKDAGESNPGRNGETRVQVHTAALVYLEECGLGCLRASQFAEGGGFYTCSRTFPGVWGSEGGHPRSTQIHLCRISLKIFSENNGI